MPPSYVNIFMGGLKAKLFEQASVRPVFWRRFIDDGFFFFFHLNGRGGESKGIYGTHELVS